ncbi:ABC transporter permease [Candidatus Bathyarchaeota archaeon]|nr:ABC transporter permease [Candidatus Bathyarchaeota archaeon]
MSEIKQGKITFSFKDAINLGFNYLRRRRDRSLLNIASISLGLSFYTSLILTDVFYQTYASIGGSSLSVESTYYWLVIIALIVSVVGITNAMLISVFERIREIGTMKCIGALDQHVLLLFLVEAFLQGLVGGFIGFILGVIAALVSTGFTTGFDIITYVDPTRMITIFLTSLSISLILSVVATMYPAYRASKLDPVEALRYEL